MAKLKKIGVWTFGIALALALVVNQLIQILLGYALQPVSSYLSGLNTLAINIIQWTLIIIIPFIVGIVFVLIYNLFSKWIGIKLEITEKKK